MPTEPTSDDEAIKHLREQVANLERELLEAKGATATEHQRAEGAEAREAVATTRAATAERRAAELDQVLTGEREERKRVETQSQRAHETIRAIIADRDHQRAVVAKQAAAAQEMARELAQMNAYNSSLQLQLAGTELQLCEVTDLHAMALAQLEFERQRALELAAKAELGRIGAEQERDQARVEAKRANARAVLGMAGTLLGGVAAIAVGASSSSRRG